MPAAQTAERAISAPRKSNARTAPVSRSSALVRARTITTARICAIVSAIRLQERAAPATARARSAARMAAVGNAKTSARRTRSVGLMARPATARQRVVPVGAAVMDSATKETPTRNAANRARPARPARDRKRARTGSAFASRRRARSWTGRAGRRRTVVATRCSAGRAVTARPRAAVTAPAPVAWMCAPVTWPA